MTLRPQNGESFRRSVSFPEPEAPDLEPKAYTFQPQALFPKPETPKPSLTPNPQSEPQSLKVNPSAVHGTEVPEMLAVGQGLGLFRIVEFVDLVFQFFRL